MTFVPDCLDDVNGALGFWQFTSESQKEENRGRRPTKNDGNVENKGELKTVYN